MVDDEGGGADAGAQRVDGRDEHADVARGVLVTANHAPRERVNDDERGLLRQAGDRVGGALNLGELEEVDGVGQEPEPVGCLVVAFLAPRDDTAVEAVGALGGDEQDRAGCGGPSVPRHAGSDAHRPVERAEGLA